MSDAPPEPPVEIRAHTLYDEVGGARTFRDLVHRFRRYAVADPVLRGRFVDEAVFDRLGDFLIQYWGGPRAYSAARGAPRLVLRHRKLALGQPDRDAWLRAMEAAVTESELTPRQMSTLMDHFAATAAAIIRG